MKNKKRIALIFLGPFPLGNVSTIRILSYCEALVTYGYYVKVFIIAPTIEGKINNSKKGRYNGVDYQYMTKTTWDGNNTFFIIKVFYYIFGLVKLFSLIVFGQFDKVLSYHDNLLFNLIGGVFFRIFGKEFILDRTEYPSNWKAGSSLKRRALTIGLRQYTKIITITEELQLFYQLILRDPSRVFLLPITIDPKRFDTVSVEESSVPKITVVFGVHNRDCLIDSIYAYRRYFQIKGSEAFEMDLIGDFDKLRENFPENNDVLHLVKQSPFRNKINFVGKINNSLIPNYLYNSTCLMTTPRAFDSGGFPTKLGEYLLSGVPVVCTSAGEVSRYLEGTNSALLVEPGDVNALGDKLIWIHENPERAKEIGANGRELALSIFNARTYIKQLVCFIYN